MPESVERFTEFLFGSIRYVEKWKPERVCDHKGEGSVWHASVMIDIMMSIGAK